MTDEQMREIVWQRLSALMRECENPQADCRAIIELMQASALQMLAELEDQQ